MLGSIWWVCLRYMWILCPLAPSHGICGMSAIADLCIPCHILIVLWIIMAVLLWTRVVYISYGTVSWCPMHGSRGEGTGGPGVRTPLRFVRVGSCVDNWSVGEGVQRLFLSYCYNFYLLYIE